MTFRRTLAVLGAGVAAAQAGHLLAYELRFAAAAQQLQASGAHAYFPALAKTGLGIASIVAIAGLFVVGAARAVAGRRLERGSAPPLLRLLAVLYTVQLACFGAQETVEALLGGFQPASAPLLILWGTAGQLPVALAAALALRWLLARLGPALELLRVPSAVALRPKAVAFAFAAVPVATEAVLRWGVMATDPLRGPPRISF